jgi:phage terminase small subunit
VPVLTNPRWEAAAQANASGKTIKDAYEGSGFKPNSAAATRFFQRPEIKARVAEIVAQRQKIEILAVQKAADRLGLTKEWVLQRLMWNAERCLRGAPVLDKDGVHTGKFSGIPQGSAANRALELCGRELGMFIQLHEIGGVGDFERLTDAELESRAVKIAERLGWDGPLINSAKDD